MNMTESLFSRLHQKSRATLTLALAFFIFLGFLVFTFFKGGIDFYTYFISSHAFHHGIRAYLLNLNDFKALAEILHIQIYTSPYYYPPLTAQLLVPFLLLTPKLAYFFWIIISCIALAFSVSLLTGKEHFLGKFLLGLFFTSTFATLDAGQVNAFLLLSLCVAYYGLTHQKNYYAGMGLACGIMFKIIPVAHWLYLIWQGRFKPALWVLVFVLALFLLSLLFVHWQGWIDFYHVMLLYSHPHQLVATPTNQALSGLFARFVHNSDQAVKLWHFSIITLGIATALICLPLKKTPVIFDCEFSLVTIAINLYMPYTWYHQNILLLIPLFLLIKHNFFHKKILMISVLSFYIFYNLHGYFWHFLIHNPLLASASVLFPLFLWLVLAVKITLEKYQENYSRLVYVMIVMVLVIFGYYCFEWHKGIDFECYFLAAKSFFAHTRPYLNLYPKQGFLYYYPPLTAELIWPLTLVGLQWAYAIWFVLSAMATAAGIYILIDNKKDFPHYLIWAFGFLPVIVTFYAGQVNCFLFLALCLAYHGLLRNKDWYLGWGIAVGIMLKWLPLAHFFYLIWRRKYKAFFIVMIAVSLLFVLGLPLAGWQDWQDFFHLLKRFGTPALPHQGLGWELSYNQAFSGMTVRFLKQQAMGLFWGYILDILIVFATAFLCWPKGDNKTVLALEFSLVTIAVNLIMPYTWYYQYTILLIPLVVLLQDILENGKTVKYKNKELILILIGYLLTDLYAPFWHSLKNPFLASIPTFFAMMLWIMAAKRVIYLKGFFGFSKNLVRNF